MTIETVDDLVEVLADQIGVYGSCKGEDCFRCRPHWTADIARRIREAVANEKTFAAIEAIRQQRRASREKEKNK